MSTDPRVLTSVKFEGGFIGGLRVNHMFAGMVGCSWIN